MPDNSEMNDFAIVGLSIHCPGTQSVGGFWRNLADGVDCITDVPADIIEPLYFETTDEFRPDRFYCSRGGFAPRGVTDPLRYGILPIAVEGADPEQIGSLMLTEAALVDADVFRKGISLDRAAIIIGKGNFAGLPQLRASEIIRTSEELIAILGHAVPDLTQTDLANIKEAYQASFGRYGGDTVTATMPNLVASSVANHFDMHGPAYTLDAACASGIVALQHAIRSMRAGEADIAVVGAMHTGQSPVFWSAFNMMGALSRKGQISPFSKDADGLLIGQGAGFMVVKPLERAIADDDRIYAVIKGTAVGSDGGGHSVLITDTAGQAKVLRAAWREARMDPADVAYVEAHGTATLVGDATEVQTLNEVFPRGEGRRAYLGSVKSNIGHLMPAAGMMGLIKTTLALYHRQIPPTLHAEEPIRSLSETRFELPQELIDWRESGLPLIAGVDAFGFGGINAHAVLTAYEEPAEQQRRYRVARRRHYSPDAYGVTAPTREDLLAKIDVENFKNQITNLIGAPSDPCRLVILNPTDERLRLAVAIVKRGEPWLGRNDIWYTEKPLLTDGGKVAFLFPGWDASGGVEHDSLVDELELDWSDPPESEEYPTFRPMVEHYQTSLLVDQALNRTGIFADIYAGHSIGEWHAARAIGMLSEEFDEGYVSFNLDPTNQMDDSLLNEFKLVAANGFLDDADVEAILDCAPEIYLMNDNCPNQRVFCAVADAVDPLVKALESRKCMAMVLPWTTPMHTPYVNVYIEKPLEAMSAITIKEGKAPIWSVATVEEIVADGRTVADAFGPGLAQTVRFRELTEKLYDIGVRVFIQSGVGALTNFVDDTLKGRDFATIQAISPLHSSVDQLRRVHALMFIMGGTADLEFMGTNPVFQEVKSLYLLPGAAPLLTQLDAVDEAFKPLLEKAARADQPAEPGPAPAAGSVPGIPPVAGYPAGPWAPPMIPMTPQGLPMRGYSRPDAYGGFFPPPGYPAPPVYPGQPYPLYPGMPYPGMPYPPYPGQLPYPPHAGQPPFPGQPGQLPYPPQPGQPPYPAQPGQPPAGPVPMAPPPGVVPAQPVPAQPTPLAQPAPAAKSATPAAKSATPAKTDKPAAAPAATPQATEQEAKAEKQAKKPRRGGTSFELPFVLNLDKYPEVMDHSIINQPVGWPHREDLFPVVPLTMNIELLAKIAQDQAPGMKVVRIGPITATNFMTLNEPFESVVKGFWKTENTVSLTIPGHLMMEVTLGHEYPTPEEGLEAKMLSQIGDPREGPSRDETYTEYSFHRQSYWSLTEPKAYGEFGMAGRGGPTGATGALLDVMGQTIGLYLHLHFKENRVSFPVRVVQIQFFEDIWDQEGVFDGTCVIRKVTDGFVQGDMLLARNGKPWCLATGWINQRVGLDDRVWQSVIHPDRAVLAQKLTDGVYAFLRDDATKQTAAFLGLRYLTRQEKLRVQELPNVMAQADYLAARIAAKDGVRETLLQDDRGLMPYPIEVYIDHDDNGKPVVRGDDGTAMPVEVSLAHRDGKGVAIIGDSPVGIDIERIETKEPSFWDVSYTAAEQDLIKAQSDPEQWAIRVWVAKEAYGKRLGTGLQGAPKRLEVERIDGESLYIRGTKIDTMLLGDDYIIGWTR